MSLHSNSGGGGGFGGLLVLLPWWIGLPLVIGTCLYAEYEEGEVARQLPAWETAAKADADGWIRRIYGEDASVIQCRHEEGSIFHCNAKGPDGLFGFDCDGAALMPLCVLCSE